MVAWRRCPAHPSAAQTGAADHSARAGNRNARKTLAPVHLWHAPPRPVGPAPSAESGGAPIPCGSVRVLAPGSPHPPPGCGSSPPHPPPAPPRCDWPWPVDSPGKADQEAVQGVVATIKSLHGMAGLQWLNPVPAHPAPRAGGASTTPSSTVLGSCSNRARRGCTWGGASRAATNSSQCSGSSWKLCRSASVSAALARALSSTKSVALRCAAAAARCRVCFAPGVSWRFGFSLRSGDEVKTAGAPASLTSPARQCHDASGASLLVN